MYEDEAEENETIRQEQAERITKLEQQVKDLENQVPLGHHIVNVTSSLLFIFGMASLLLRLFGK